MIYFISDGEFVKVGYTANVDKRLCCYGKVTYMSIAKMVGVRLPQVFRVLRANGKIK